MSEERQTMQAKGKLNMETGQVEMEEAFANELMNRGITFYLAKHDDVKNKFLDAFGSGNQDVMKEICDGMEEKIKNGIRRKAFVAENEIENGDEKIIALDGAPRETIMETIQQVFTMDEKYLQEIHDLMYSSENYDETTLAICHIPDGPTFILVTVFAIE